MCKRNAVDVLHSSRPPGTPTSNDIRCWDTRSDTIREFCDAPEKRVLVVAGDALLITLGLPRKAAPRGSRLLAFVKLAPVRLSVEGLGDTVLVTELGAEPLETLERLLADVYLPLLSNPANTEGWSDVVSHEVVDALHGFLAHVNIANGAARGETCLPLPPIDAASAVRLTAKSRVHLLENAVMTWTAQIKVRRPCSGLHSCDDTPNLRAIKTTLHNVNA